MYSISIYIYIHIYIDIYRHIQTYKVIYVYYIYIESLRAVPACSFYISHVAVFMHSSAMPRKSQQILWLTKQLTESGFKNVVQLASIYISANQESMAWQ